MVQAQLTDGRIIELPKDCHCVGLHDGPHWIHADDLWRKENNKILDIAKAKLETVKTLMDASMVEILLDRFKEEELPRLRTKRREMEQAGIVRIIRD